MGVVKPAPESILEEAVVPSEEANHSLQIYAADEWGDGFPYQVLIGTGVALMALVLLAAVSFQCSSTWRWLMGVARQDGQDDVEGDLSQQNAIRISHSLPDLQSEPITHEYVQEQKDNKKVLRQTTLPIVPMRHQSFQRQLSHRLDLPNIKFSICSLENRSDSRLGLIKPELYKKDLTRQESNESSSTGEMESAGKLHFALRYDKEIEGLVVKVLEARELPVKDVSGSSDPYVKIYLLPDRKKKYQTKVHRKNLNPIFNETFIFSVSHEDLQERYLQFSVYDFDRFSRHDLIGQVVLRDLSDCTDFEHEIEYTMDIMCTTQDKVDLGELMLSLCYLPTAGRLTLTVIKARNLKKMDITGSSDPYVKVYLLCQGKRIKKKKTSVKKGCLCPVYNEALVFDVPAENVEDVSLIIKVIDYDRIGSNELMGCTAIGASFIGIGRDHWLEMLDNPRKPVAQWYTLSETVAGHIPSADQLPVSLSCLTRR
ncbi:synaptotagmin-10 isoform X3 [Nasonia vitripennis]|uniref:C2 domain-containing protein n=1 Tax=Nasonia vitripennis TaxID=7425 RepID=A0A7M7Q4G9_NASVI|nr:synaptotagmin-10 isoform X2 [Nasonia vitripennis]XP_031781493.1 synaptotagmin-10 isoform X3 [Nasonia vitripennis]